jgi:hypothetical protein
MLNINQSVMKKIASLTFLLLSMCGLFTSCSKDDGTDIRDSYIGTYTGTETYTNSGTDYSNNISLTVAKSEVSSDKIILTATFFNDAQEIVQATIKDGEFSTAFTSEINGVSKTVTITTGKLNGSTISYSYTAPGFVTVTVNATKI